MRHNKHRHQLGVKKEHREALVANLAAALFTHGRIKTTLAKAKALRPFSEKIITLAKRAAATEDAARKLHFRRLAIARIRDKDAVKKLFDERAAEFANREGGYTRIYKLGNRVGDAAEMAIIELIPADDEGYGRRSRGKASKPKKAKAEAEAPVAEESDVAVAEEPAEEAVEAEAPAEEPKAEAAVAEEPKAEEEPKKD